MFLTVKKNYVWLKRYKNRAKTRCGGRGVRMDIGLEASRSGTVSGE